MGNSENFTMPADSTDDFEFDCPDCGECFEVNPGMRDAMLEHGCPICGADVSETAFTPPPP